MQVENGSQGDYFALNEVNVPGEGGAVRPVGSKKLDNNTKDK